MGRVKVADQETPRSEGGQRKGGVAGPGPGGAQHPSETACPREGGLCSGAGREGQCHLAPGNRRHFLAADRRLAMGGAAPNEPARGRGRGGGALPSAPQPRLRLQAEGPGRGDGGSRAGAGMGGAGMLPPRLGLPLPPPRVTPAQAHPGRLCPHPRSLGAHAL